MATTTTNNGRTTPKKKKMKGISFAAMTGDTASFTFEYNGESMEVEYLSSAFTPALEERLYATVDENGQSTYILLMLDALIDSWEVFDEEGEEVEPTADNMKDMPIKFLTALLDALMNDVKGGIKEEGNGSLAG